MAAIQSRPAKKSSVVKAEILMNDGYNLKTATVAFAAGMEVGAVVETDGDGTYSWVAAADVATLNADIAIVVDDSIYDDATVGDRSMAVMHQGPAVVVREGLKFADSLSSGQVDTVVAAIEALGIKVDQQV